MKHESKGRKGVRKYEKIFYEITYRVIGTFIIKHRVEYIALLMFLCDTSSIIYRHNFR